MQKEIYLRICYWWGAIADALLGMEMFCSAFLGSNSPFTGFGMTIDGGPEYRYAIAIAATFMLVWTILLLWADRKPLERKNILLLLIPVIFGLRISIFLGYYFGVLSIERVIFDTILSMILLILIIFSFFNARKTEN